MNGAHVNVDELRAEIGQARAELGQTVQELAGRLDVGARMRAGAAHTKDRMGEVARSPVPLMVMAGGIAVAVFAAVVLAIRERRR